MFTNIAFSFLVLGVLIGLFFANSKPFPTTNAKSIFDFTVESGSEQPVGLAAFKGKKAYLVVNVASQCGLTNQNYAELSAVYEKYR